MSRKRVLVAHPILGASGGGNGVAAWALEALRDTCDVTLVTLEPVDIPAVNRTFGTSLRPTDFRIILAPRRYTFLLKHFPTQGALLEICVLMRLARQTDRKGHFDVLLGTQNEADFGRRGIHYVHHPWVFLPRPEHEMRWFHYIPGVLNGYRAFCQLISQSSNEGLRRNLSLANSTFIAGRIRQVHGVPATIVYPPVAGRFPNIPWKSRRQAFLAVGRIHGCKRWEMAVAILDEVRRRGFEVGLTLIGSRDDHELGLRLHALAATRPWFEIRHDISRAELAHEMATFQFGLHTMEDEHFGMAPAELQRAGCIVFVHNSGGPVEIVGNEPALLFDTVQDAANKICAALESPDELARLCRHVAAQRDRFTAEAFCKSLRDIVQSFA